MKNFLNNFFPNNVRLLLLSIHLVKYHISLEKNSQCYKTTHIETLTYFYSSILGFLKMKKMGQSEPGACDAVSKLMGAGTSAIKGYKIKISL